ncbi:MAG: DnaB-like helicase C-terminal domain-containing protein [Planctomycetota bacterium]
MGDLSHHGPCTACGSRDNVAWYENGSGWCFGCNTYYAGDATDGGERVTQEQVGREMALREGVFSEIPSRALDEATCRKFGYRVGVGEPWHAADYYDARGKRTAQKIRHPDKTFAWVGEPKGSVLFGQQLWKPGRRVVVTEGELDAMSVAQAQNLRWPVVSVPNGAGGAKRAFIKSLEWLEAFEEVVILFDQDEQGEAAAVECAEVLSPGKAYIGRLPMKDANEVLVAAKGAPDKVRILADACWQAAPYRPDCIVAGLDLIEKVLVPSEHGVDHPWVGLDAYLRGQRRGEISCWCGGTGAGKSQLVREIAYHLRQKGEVVGIVALEENTRKAALSQVSIQMNMKLHDPKVRDEVDVKEIRSAAEAALDGMFFYDHFGSVDADVLIPKIRFMVKGLGVTWVILDHVSIMVSGVATEGDERKRLDELMTRLRTTVEECGFGMHLVAHLRKAGGTPHEEGGRISMDDLRGSAAIKQISDNIIAAERNQQSDNDDSRHTTTLRVLKCREFGDTGIAAHVCYSKETGRITEHTLDATEGENSGKEPEF